MPGTKHVKILMHRELWSLVKWLLLAMMGILELFVEEHLETTTHMICFILTCLSLDLFHYRGIILSWNLCLHSCGSTSFSWSSSWASYGPHWDVWGFSVEHQGVCVSDNYIFCKLFPYYLSRNAVYCSISCSQDLWLLGMTPRISSSTSLMIQGLKSWEIRTPHLLRILL